MPKAWEKRCLFESVMHGVPAVPAELSSQKGKSNGALQPRPKWNHVTHAIPCILYWVARETRLEYSWLKLVQEAQRMRDSLCRRLRRADAGGRPLPGCGWDPRGGPAGALAHPRHRPPSRRSLRTTLVASILRLPCRNLASLQFHSTCTARPRYAP